MRPITGRIARVENDWARLLLATAWWPLQTLHMLLDYGITVHALPGTRVLGLAYRMYCAAVVGEFVGVPWSDEAQ